MIKTGFHFFAPRVFTGTALAFLALSIPAHAQEVGKLYAPRPPEGSAFVRVVSALDGPSKIKFGPLDAIELAPDNGNATDFRLMKGGTQTTVVLDGKNLPGAVEVPKDTFVTLLLWQENGETKYAAVTDQTRGHDDLKAELRAYNLVAGCTAEIIVASGPKVFGDVETGTSQRRSINPVAADLQGKCGQAVSKPLSLPNLKAGDRFSLFLVGQADAPVLRGQIDRTDMAAQQDK